MRVPKKTIQDSYEILEEIGKGGMAHVYKARQESLGRDVAIKEIKPAIAASAELVERFKREARTAASLVHENIIQVYNFGEQARGPLFIVMEFVEGEDLKTLLARAGTIPPRIAAIVSRDVARALSYAHARGLVHRDVKPGNIMISDRGEIKLMDFGIVREMDSELTRTGAFLGTPSYMSPEQFLGEEITPASDVFSMGVVLYEVLAGEKPFKADSESSLSKKIRTEKEPKLRSMNPEVPRRLQKIVAQCLRKNPAKRMRSAEDLANALGSFVKSRSREEDRRELVAWIKKTTGKDLGPTLDSVPDRKPKKAPKPAPAPTAAIPSVPTGADKTATPSKRSTRSEVKKEEKKQIEKIESPPEPEKKKKSADKQDKPRGDAGEVIVKWIWRAILLAIAALAAVIVFLVFSPGHPDKPAKEKSSIEKVIDWARDKLFEKSDKSH